MLKKKGMTIITDRRVLNALARRYNFEYSSKYKYVTCNAENARSMDYKGNKYGAVYLDGCIYPFICKAVI